VSAPISFKWDGSKLVGADDEVDIGRVGSTTVTSPDDFKYNPGALDPIAGDLAAAISANALGPHKASDDHGAMETHKLPDQIEADRYLSGKQARSKGGRGILFSRGIPPGTRTLPMSERLNP
jgi:hypothetical protein